MNLQRNIEFVVKYINLFNLILVEIVHLFLSIHYVVITSIGKVLCFEFESFPQRNIIIPSNHSFIGSSNH